MTARARLEAVLGPQTTRLILDAVREDMEAFIENVQVHIRQASDDHLDGEWLSIRRAAEILDTTSVALRARVRRGWIDAYRPDGSSKLYIKRSDIDAAMKRQRPER